MNHQERLDEKFEDFKKDVLKTPPVPCDFKVGDKVTFTNDAGIQFENREVIGFAEDTELNGRFIYLDGDAYWFPHKPSELTKTD